MGIKSLEVVGCRTKEVILQNMKNYKKLMEELDDCSLKAIQVLKDGLDSSDTYFKLRCAEIILKKVLPDKQIRQVQGHDGGPVHVETTENRREVILNVIGVLDSLGFDELKEKVSERRRIFELNAGAIETAQGTMEEEEETGREGVRSGQRCRDGESQESDILVEAGQGDGDAF